MRLNCGEGNGTGLAGRTSQSTARVARKGILMALLTVSLLLTNTLGLGSALCLPRMALDG
jgi:hypothetical protein